MEGDSASRLVFGPFELRTESGELFRDGVRIRLQPQPTRLLELLARRSGEIVSREEIRRQIWGEDTFFDLEQGLNFSIRRIRVALDDSATQPRYLETVPRRGYRFLAPVQAEPASAPAASLPAPPPDSRQDSRRRTVPGFVATLVLGLLLTGSPGERQPAGVDAAMQPERLSAAAFQAYSEGRFLAGRHAPGDRALALAALEDARALAPGFAPAHAAWAHLRLDFSRPPEDVVAPAETAARRALTLDPCLNEARLVLIDIGLYFRFDQKTAKAEIDRALACDPRDAEIHRVHAGWLAAQGQLDPAIEAARRAQLLDSKPEVVLAISPGISSWRAAMTRRSISRGGRWRSSPRTPGRARS